MAYHDERPVSALTSADKRKEPRWPRVADVRLTPAPLRDLAAGVVGFVSLAYGQFRLDGLVVRRTEGGRLALSFPTRTDARGRRHPVVRPLDDVARVDIERQVLGALEIDRDRRPPEGRGAAAPAAETEHPCAVRGESN